MSAEWTLGVAGAVIIALAAVVWFFIQWYFKSRDDDKKMINDLCESISAITAKQEGQLSFAKALLEQQDQISRIGMKVDSFHTRLDDIYDIVKGLLK